MGGTRKPERCTGDQRMSLINTTIQPFEATGYINGEFKDFSD